MDKLYSSKGKNGRLLAATSREFHPGPCLWAVSYTHLDVYKRQALFMNIKGTPISTPPKSDGIAGSLRATAAITNTGGIRAIMLMLDVYKRQIGIYML